MIVILGSFELVNVAYYILLPWHQLSANNAVAVAAAASLFGRPAGIAITLLVAISCAGSITSNVFSVGRLTIAASQRNYLPAIFSKRGLPHKRQSPEQEERILILDAPLYVVVSRSDYTANSLHSYANLLTLLITLIYISTGSFRALLTFVGMATWVFYVSTVVGLLILRRREPQLDRPYRPTIILPVTFVVVGTLVIIRSAIFAPVQSGLLAALLIAGAVVSRLRGR
jgi:solute carrier family 7 (L-type amino acid transporter), member 9/15